MADPMSMVPGPPRGRRRETIGDALRRVQSMRDRETESGNAAVWVLRIVGDVILLLKDLATDSRVPRSDKIVAGIAAAYLVTPVDLVPDWIPVFGQADDLAVVMFAVRRLMAGAGYDVIYELWRGTDEGLALVLTLAGVEK
ncbi:MAG: DUF1232 domain-containing protein [Nitriliruptorales bacterium]|nr:DUF1232 domain-containing protein [Nitriliruptorales bacterium]